VSNKPAIEIVKQAAQLLMRRKQFYYNLLCQFLVTEKKGVGTMGVCWMDKKMHLIYDPDFVSRYSPLELAPILEHEGNHFLYDHVADFKDTGTKSVFESEEEVKDHIRQQALKQQDHKLQNIAMDRSINVYIDDLPNIRILRGEMLTGDKQKDEKAQGKIIRVFEKHAEDPSKDIVEVSGITVESFRQLLIDSGYKGDPDKVERFESWKYYYDLLKSCPKIQEEAAATQTMDVHFVPGTSSEGGQSFNIDGEPQDGQGQPSEGQGNGQPNEREDKELSPKGDGQGEGDKKKEVTETPGQGPSQQEVGRMAFDALRKSNQSKLPGHLRGMMERVANMYDSTPLPWYVILRRMINTSIKTVMENDVNIRNRRNTSPQILPGYKNRPLIDIGVVWDVSGSCMDGETQGHFVNECNALIKAGAQLTVYYTDAAVEHVQKVTKKLVPEKYEIRGGGGTALDVGVQQAIADGNHIIIQLTDGYYNFTLTKADLKGRKVITCTTGDRAPKHYGPCIDIDPSGKK
jgi:predicted metal-dependent peptidase